MASILKHYYYRSGSWNDGGTLNTGNSSLGHPNGTMKARSVFKISLDSLSAGYKRTSLKINLSVASAGPGTAFNDSVHYILTNSNYDSGTYEVQGTIYSSKESGTFYSSTSSGKTTVPETTIDISSVPSGTNTVYLWMYTGYQGGASYTIQSIGLTEKPPEKYYTKVSVGDITTSSNQIFKPSETIKVSWKKGSDGVNNTLQKYKVWLECNSKTTTPVEVEHSNRSESFECDIILPADSSRGKNVVAKVQGVGSKENLNSDTVSKTIGKTNQLPSQPSAIEANGDKLTALVNITYNNIPTSDSNNTIDKDGNFDAVYYKIGTGAETKISTSSITITINSDGVVSGSNTISFYSKDTCGEICEQPKTFNFNATFKPEIGSNISINHNNIPGMVSGEEFATKTDITFDMNSGTALSINLYCRQASSEDGLQSASKDLIDSNLYSYTQGSGTNAISVSKANLASLITPGNYFQFAFEVKDSTSTSDTTSWLSIGRRPKIPRLPTYKSIDTGAISGRAKNNYFKNTFKITYTNEKAASGYAPITSIKLQARTTKNSYEKELNRTTGENTMEVTFNNILPNTSVDFYFIIVDTAGQQNENSREIFTLIQSSSLAFSGNSVGIDNINLRPNSNSNPFKISHPKAQSSGTQDDKMVYTYYLKYDTKVIEIKKYEYVDSEDPNTLWIEITSNDINAYAKTLFPGSPNDAYKVEIIVEAEDGFGEVKTLTTPQDSFTINFTEPPYFADSSLSFTLKHYYYTGGTGSKDSGIDIPTLTATNWDDIKDIIMVNSGEGIVFKIPKATDPNDDIKEYRIYLARGDFRSSKEVPTYDQIDPSSFKLLITIPISDLTEKDGYYFYRYTASKYSKNEYFYFKAKVFDETTNSSDFIVCQQCIIGCRTVEPSFSTGDIKAERKEETDGTSTITLNYNFTITDLGGSASKNGWSTVFYNNAPNFERTLPSEYSNYKNKVYLKIDIAPTQDFEDGEGYYSLTQPIICNNGLINASSTRAIFDKIDLESFPANSKIFMRFTLTVPFGMQNSNTVATVSSVPNVFTYFGSIPTVAHRVHKVGINTTTFGADDVMVVENYQGTRFIRFKGTDALNAAVTQQIVFDLLQGSVDGLIIDGGSW